MPQYVLALCMISASNMKWMEWNVLKISAAYNSSTGPAPAQSLGCSPWHHPAPDVCPPVVSPQHREGRQSVCFKLRARDDAVLNPRMVLRATGFQLPSKCVWQLQCVSM